MGLKVSVRRHLRRRPPPIYAVHRITAGVPESRLRPRARRSEHGILPGQMYGIDQVLGDDQYIFLSIERAIYGYGAGDAYYFSALDLIRRGALWRERDILETQEARELLRALRVALRGDYSWSGYSAREIEETAKKDFDVSIALEKLQHKADELTHSGKEAREMLINAATNPHASTGGEILMPKSLELGKALGVELRD